MTKPTLAAMGWFYVEQNQLAKIGPGDARPLEEQGSTH